MVKSEEMISKYKQMVLPILGELQLELYDLEYISHQKILRIYIMNPETKTADIEDCVKVDRAMGEPLELAEWVPEEIVLEVSSPGVYRKLKSMTHFQWAKGERADLQLNRPFTQQEQEKLAKKQIAARRLKGTVATVEQNAVLIECDGGMFTISYEDIKKAALDPEDLKRK